MDSVDLLDLQLIRCLQDNPRAPYSAIGRITGVSETTVKRRVDDLIARGIIQPAMIANIERLGYRTRAYLYIKVAPEHIFSVAQTLCTYPETSSVGLITGRFDVICLIALPSVRALTRFIAERIAPIKGIVTVETAICSDMLKMFADWRIPIEAFLEAADGGSKAGAETEASPIAAANSVSKSS